MPRVESHAHIWCKGFVKVGNGNKSFKRSRQTWTSLSRHWLKMWPPGGDTTFEMISRFLEQQQAVCWVLAAERSTWHLMPKDNGITVLEEVSQLLCLSVISLKSWPQRERSHFPTWSQPPDVTTQSTYITTKRKEVPIWIVTANHQC